MYGCISIVLKFGLRHWIQNQQKSVYRMDKDYLVQLKSRWPLMVDYPRELCIVIWFCLALRLLQYTIFTISLIQYSVKKVGVFLWLYSIFLVFKIKYIDLTNFIGWECSMEILIKFNRLEKITGAKQRHVAKVVIKKQE